MKGSIYQEAEVLPPGMKGEEEQIPHLNPQLVLNVKIPSVVPCLSFISLLKSSFGSSLFLLPTPMLVMLSQYLMNLII